MHEYLSLFQCNGKSTNANAMSRWTGIRCNIKKYRSSVLTHYGIYFLKFLKSCAKLFDNSLELEMTMFLCKCENCNFIVNYIESYQMLRKSCTPIFRKFDLQLCPYPILNVQN